MADYWLLGKMNVQCEFGVFDIVEWVNIDSYLTDMIIVGLCGLTLIDVDFRVLSCEIGIASICKFFFSK